MREAPDNPRRLPPGSPSQKAPIGHQSYPAVESPPVVTPCCTFVQPSSIPGDAPGAFDGIFFSHCDRARIAEPPPKGWDRWPDAASTSILLQERIPRTPHRFFEPLGGRYQNIRLPSFNLLHSSDIQISKFR